MIVKFQQLPPIGTNAYILINEKRKECIVIDAPAGAFDWASQIAKEYDCTLSGLILTHGHWDHILDAYRFVENNIATYGHRDDTILFESPEKIIEEMKSGVEIEHQSKVLAITDRAEAIKTAGALAQQNDIVLIAGKGHENYQEINGERLPFDDKSQIMNYEL